MRKMLVVMLIGLFGLVGCTGGPKADADKIADRFPAEISVEGEDEAAERIVVWEREDDRTELSLEVQSNYGYITLEYAGDDATDDMTAYITIMVYANTSAATVELQRNMLDWEVQGVRFDTERAGRNAYDLATFPGGQLAYLQNEDTIFEVRVIADDVETEIPEVAMESIFETIFEISENE